MNAMFIVDGVLVSPETSDTILDGVTRNSVLALAKDLGIPVEIRRFSVVELEESLNNNTLTEAFGVGTAATIKPMSEIGINGKRYPLNNPDNWKIVPWLLRELDGIRRGSIDDRFNWNIPV